MFVKNIEMDVFLIPKKINRFVSDFVFTHHLQTIFQHSEFTLTITFRTESCFIFNKSLNKSFIMLYTHNFISATFANCRMYTVWSSFVLNFLVFHNTTI